MCVCVWGGGGSEQAPGNPNQDWALSLRKFQATGTPTESMLGPWLRTGACEGKILVSPRSVAFASLDCGSAVTWVEEKRSITTGIRKTKGGVGCCPMLVNLIRP